MAGFPRQKMNRPPMDMEDRMEPPETPGEKPDAEDIAEGPEPKMGPMGKRAKPKAKKKMMQPPDFEDGPPPRATNLAMLARAAKKFKKG